MAAELLTQHRDLDRTEPDAAARLRHLDAEPALVGHRRPQRSIERGAARSVGAHLGGRGEPVEQVAGAFLECDLIVREVEVHRDVEFRIPADASRNDGAVR